MAAALPCADGERCRVRTSNRLHKLPRGRAVHPGPGSEPVAGSGQSGGGARVGQSRPAGADQQPAVVSGAAVGRVVDLDLPAAGNGLAGVSGSAAAGPAVAAERSRAGRDVTSRSSVAMGRSRREVTGMPGGERCTQGTRQENGVPDPGRLVLSKPQPTRPTRSLAGRARWPRFRHPAISSGGLPFRRGGMYASPRIGDRWTTTSKEAWPGCRGC
jgi:hypothetical protein